MTVTMGSLVKQLGWGQGRQVAGWPGQEVLYFHLLWAN